MLEKIKALIASVCTAYIGSLPTTPDNAVSITPYGGGTRDLVGSEYREPYFQVRVRNTSYPTGYALCESIADLLHGVHNTSDFLLIAQVGDIQGMGRDNNNRNEWTVNFRAYVKGA